MTRTLLLWCLIFAGPLAVLAQDVNDQPAAVALHTNGLLPLLKANGCDEGWLSEAAIQNKIGSSASDASRAGSWSGCHAAAKPCHHPPSSL